MASQNTVNHIRIAEYFHLDEFQCPCCLQVILHPILLQKLNSLRNKIKNSIIITSGYRCSSYNILERPLKISRGDWFFGNWILS